MEPGTTTIHAPCSECGHKPGETASPRWPLWLRTMPWLAVVAVVVLAAGLGLRDTQSTQVWSVNRDVSGFWLREWSWERVDQATRSAPEAALLRSEALDVADFFGGLVEPGATLHTYWQDPYIRTGGDSRQYGWPLPWMTVQVLPSSRNRASWGRIGFTFFLSNETGFRSIETTAFPIMALLSVGAAWVLTRSISLALRSRDRPVSNRATKVLMSLAAITAMGVLLSVPTPGWWPSRWDLQADARQSGTSTGATLDKLHSMGPDTVDFQAVAAQIMSGPQEQNPSIKPSPQLVLKWINTADGTTTKTFFGSPWPLFSYGTSVCDPPSSGTPTTRFGWPEWRYERLVIWAGTRGFPSRAGYIALEPAGIGIWSFFALIAYWLAALTRHLITRTILRRRQRAARCQACGYQLSIIKPGS